MCEISEVATLSDLECVFENVVSVVIGFAGIALFIMLVVGGFKWLTAGGDPKAIEDARKTISYAIGGIALIAISYIFILLIEKITGVTVTQFRVFQPE